MPSAGRFSLLLTVLVLSAPVLALPAHAPDDLEQNRRQLARWRNDPEHYARLQRDLEAFQALPAERQERLRQLDRDLHQEDPPVQVRLIRVMDRYATWLEHLPPEDRRGIETAPNPAERLRIIRDLREQEWIAHLPRARREQLTRTPEDRRPALIAEFRQQEHKWRREWQRALAAPNDQPAPRRAPTRPAELPPEIRAYLDDSLRPALTEEEKEKLKRAEGPQFGRTLLELAEKHPTGLPGPATGPMGPRDLPKDVQDRVGQLAHKDKTRLHWAEGHWPEYASAVTQALRHHGGMPQELGPCHPKDMPANVQEFLQKELRPRLDEKEREQLEAAEGHWPDYPRAIRDLARQHNLPVPGVSLPGPRDFWDKLRSGTADKPAT